MSNNIIEVKNLSKQFNLEAGFFAKNKNKVYAVNDVSFSIEKGGTYGIVGESGCGKTTTARLIIQMYKQTLGNIIYTDNNGTILHRWFIVESDQTRTSQYKISLHRDVMADFYDSILDSPCFIEKAIVAGSNDLVFN